MASILTPCINDAAYVSSASTQAVAIVAEAVVQSLVQAALLIWKRHTNGIITDMRQELADRRMAMAEATLAHARAGWVQEKALVNATMGEATPNVNYSTMGAADAAVHRAWNETNEAYYEGLRKFGINAGPCDAARTSQGMALGHTDILSHVMRAAEARQIALYDRRFSRQNAVLGLGRGIMQEASAMGRLGGYRDDIRQSLLGTINSGMSLFGYASQAWIRGGNQWQTRQQVPPLLRRAFGMGYEPTSTATANSALAYTSAITDSNVVGIPLDPVSTSSSGGDSNANAAN